MVKPVICCSYLCEVNGEDGVRAAAGVVHARAGCGAVDVPRLHQLFHVTEVLHEVLRQVWNIFFFYVQKHIQYKLVFWLP